MDAMPEKQLVRDHMEFNGGFCTLGTVAHARGLDTQSRDPEETDYWAEQLNISEAMVREIVFMNDEAWFRDETPEQRWERMRKWVSDNIQGES
ncbi:hypothetical protein ACUN9Y_09525 [Halomonas sp. V046]|uniref:hypothetical protein n=1 Tax=Halomonas sp. V046 TaxID=3459611 RepID=UPI0040450575